MLERIRDTLRGARQLESLVLIIVFALVGLCFVGTGSLQKVSDETPLEARIRGILTYIEGVKDAQVMITEDEEGGITGIVVVANGVSDMTVRLNVQNAVMTLLDAELSQIEIINRGMEDMQ